MKNIKNNNLTELTFEEKVNTFGGDTGDGANLLGQAIGWLYGTANQIAGAIGDAIGSFAPPEGGVSGYYGCKL